MQKPQGVKRFFTDCKKFNEYLFYSVKSKLKSEVSGSTLNWLWWFLDPIFYMLVYSFISVVIFRSEQEYFPIYIIIGVIIWTFFNKVVMSSTGMLKNNANIVAKCYVPKYIFLLQSVFVNMFKLLVSFSIIFAMLLMWQVQISVHILMIIPLFLMLFSVTFGLSALVLHLSVYIGDMSNIVSIFLRFAFYLSGIFYSIKDNVPYPFNKIIMSLNPVYVAIDGARESILYRKFPEMELMILWFFIGLLLSVMGVFLIYKYENDYVKVSK